MNQITKKAFTLAEVLIVLGIIGVIAALTIPALLSNSNDAAKKAQFKKAYSVLNQAYSLMIKDNGSLKDVCADAKCLRDTLEPYLKTNKSCDSGTINECWSTSYMPLEEAAFAAPAAFDPFGGTPGAANNLADGTTIGYFYISQGCDDISKTGLADCAVITIDINGAKGKHIAGEDLFAIHMQAEGLKPFGITGDSYENFCNDTDKRGCAAEYLYK